MTARDGYVLDLLEKRVGDLELGQLRFLRSETSDLNVTPKIKLADLFRKIRESEGTTTAKK